jgi:hypothetical protein
MSISVNSIFSIFGIYSELNKKDGNSNKYIPINNIITNGNNILSYYENLAKISTTINIMLIYFSNGQFKELSSIFTLEFYNNLSIELNNIKYEKDKNYEIIRNTVLLSLQGLWQCMNQYYNILFLTTENNYYSNILNNKDNLNKYVKSLLNEKTLFPDQTINTVAVTMKPEYIAYVKLYGFPEGGVFDSDKLAQILLNL